METWFNPNDPDIRERLVLENDLAFAFLGKIPIVPGHTLVCPKRSVAFSKDMTEQEWQHVLLLKEGICHILMEFLDVEGFNFAWNEGAIAGQTVSHFHLHIVPRKEGDSGITQYEPRVFLYRPGSRCPSPQEELRDFAKQLRDCQ